MTTVLVESTTIPQATGKAGRWKAVLLTPGKGSSGLHTEAAIRESGPKALRKGAKSFITHNRLENGEPDPFQMWGFLAEDSHYEDGVGLVGEIEVLPSFRDRVAEVAPHTALSVYVSGNVDSDGTITEYLDDPQNGVDLVVYPGRPGSALVEKLYESAKTSAVNVENGTATAYRKTESKESHMEIQELAGKVDKVQRAHLMAPILESDCIWVNECSKNAREPLTLCRSALEHWEKFPVLAQHLLTDAASQCIIFLKDNNWLDVTVHEDEESERYADDRRRVANPYGA